MEQQRCGRCKSSLPIDKFSPSYRGRIGTWCKSCMADYVRARSKGTAPTQEPVPHETRTCAKCGGTFVPKRLDGRSAYCGFACKDRAKKDRQIAERETAKPIRHCVWCSVEMPRRMRSDARFCSEECNSRAHAMTRKFWKRFGESRTDSALILRTELAERDGLDCYLCGAALTLSSKHPDPLYASVDHVHPLAKGGTNDRSNLRLAHLVCNLRKRAELVA